MGQPVAALFYYLCKLMLFVYICYLDDCNLFLVFFNKYLLFFDK